MTIWSGVGRMAPSSGAETRMARQRATPSSFGNPVSPNNASNVTKDPERCLVLTLDGDDWNDRACLLRLPYACERTLPGL